MKRLMVMAVAAVAAASALAGDLTERIAAKYKVTKTDEWFGGRRTVFDFEGHDAWVVEPPADVKPAAGMPWTWTLQWRTAFVPRTGVPRLLKLGWHHAAMESLSLAKDDREFEVNKRFRDFLVNDLGFNAKANLIGMSWGGFFSTRYAATYPADVGKVYLDAPLLNFEGFKSVPGFWQKTMPEKGWKDDPRMPVNMSRKLADTDVKILLLYGGKDDVVPPTYNCARFAVFYKSAGGNPDNFKMVCRPSFGHHPHGVAENDDTIVDFFASAGTGLTDAYLTRFERASKWYLPSRFGVFYHWGLFTGGGCRAKVSYAKPLTYATPAAFEAAAPDAALVARNFAASAKAIGAKYSILTLWHTCGGHMLLYPSALPEFLNKTTIDYVGPYLDEAKKAGLHAMVYFPTDSNNWDVDPEHPTIDPKVARHDSAEFNDFLCRVLDELKARYGDRIEGFWIDGGFSSATAELPEKIHSLWPDAVVIGNNITDFRVNVDISTTEVCSPNDAKPLYSRPESFRANGSFGGAVPQRDLNEDDVTVGGWWYGGEKDIGSDLARMLKEPQILVRRIVSSLGQRGRWNCTLGVGPRIDGTLSPRAQPVFDNLRKFLAWAGPSIYNTKGPAGTFFDPGYAGSLNGSSVGAYYSVTQSLDDPKTFYVFITGLNDEKLKSGKERNNVSIFQTNGHKPRRVSDLRTGREYAFTAPYGTRIENIDFGDIATYGATVLKFEF